MPAAETIRDSGAGVSERFLNLGHKQSRDRRQSVDNPQVRVLRPERVDDGLASCAGDTPAEHDDVDSAAVDPGPGCVQVCLLAYLQSLPPQSVGQLVEHARPPAEQQHSTGHHHNAPPRLVAVDDPNSILMRWSGGP